MKTPTMLLLALCAAVPNTAPAGGFYAEALAEDADRGHFAFGYDFASGLGLEVGYRRLDEGRMWHFNGDRRLDDVDGAEIAVRGDIHVRPRFALTGRLGLFDWNGETLRFDPATHLIHIDEKEGVSPVIGAGLRFEMTEHVALVGEVVYTDPQKLDDHRGSVRPLVGLRGSF